MFPTSGTNGWEAFGTVVTTLPIAYPLPVKAKAYYYDPVRLHGIGPLCDAIVLGFADGTCFVRHRRMTSEAEFTLTNVWDDVLLDEYVLEPQGAPCSLVLDIYDDDRETILQSFGTDPEHPFPFLVEPTAYAEQEIDVAAGAATLGTLSFAVIDKSTIPGDQDSGIFTSLLARYGLNNITGRRARMRRFISEDLGWVVLADGPAGTSSMESDYASFAGSIRDTRETERKISLNFLGLEGSVIPEGPVEGYGDGLIPPLAPLVGHYMTLSGAFGLVDVASFNTAARRMVSKTTIDAIQAVAPNFDDPEPVADWVNRGAYWIKWREQGSSGPWIEMRSDLVLFLYYDLSDPATPARPDGAPLLIHQLYLGTAPDNFAILPTSGQYIEFFIMGPRSVPPSDPYPLTLEGITAGELLTNIYAGVYSRRAENGDIVPTGILYDADQLALMIDPVRLHLTEPIEDARDWTEKMIYSPTGWVPALDDLGRISPVSQVPPSDLLGLKNINNANSEPSPDWNAGNRIINVLTFTYPRDYRPTDPANAETGDGLAKQDVILEFRDEPSITRNGEQTFDIDGSAFRAVGTSAAAPVGTLEAELGYQLAYLRDQYVKWRYALGAPAFSLGLWRISLPTLRCGEWVSVDLSWLPDYITGRRGLVGLGQVVSIGDLDCCWRRGLIELVAVPAEEGYS